MIPSSRPARRQASCGSGLCGVGSWGGRCLSLGDYVTRMGPTDGPTAPPERARVGYPPEAERRPAVGLQLVHDVLRHPLPQRLVAEHGRVGALTEAHLLELSSALPDSGRRPPPVHGPRHPQRPGVLRPPGVPADAAPYLGPLAACLNAARCRDVAYEVRAEDEGAGAGRAGQTSRLGRRA